MIRTLRFSIAGLMGVILVAAIGLAALHNPTELWAGVIFLLTCGVLALAIVGVACRGQGERAWWLGLALFGWGYFTLAFSSPREGLPRLPTTAVLKAIMGDIAEPPPGIMGGGFRCIGPLAQFGGMGVPFGGLADWQIGHCLWSLAAALLGGTLGRLLFAVPAARKDEPSASSQPAARTARRWWRRPGVIGLAGLVLFDAFALIGLRKVPDLWAGGAFLFTWGLIGLAALGAFSTRGQLRATWLGAALFGAGYMILIFGQNDERQPAPQIAANYFLNALRTGLPTALTEFPVPSGGVTAANARIMKTLERPVPMWFPGETPLEDVLKYIQDRTEGTDGNRIAIYVDPVGLNEAEKTIRSPISIDLEGIPLKSSLRLALKQLGLVYSVRDGLLLITSESADDPFLIYEDPFLLVGNCLLAVLAAGLGGTLAPLVAERNSV
jgi:hypothetical protein